MTTTKREVSWISEALLYILHEASKSNTLIHRLVQQSYPLGKRNEWSCRHFSLHQIRFQQRTCSLCILLWKGLLDLAIFFVLSNMKTTTTFCFYEAWHCKILKAGILYPFLKRAISARRAHTTRFLSCDIVTQEKCAAWFLSHDMVTLKRALEKLPDKT